MSREKDILDTYWPVIEAVEHMREHYTGKVCSESVGAVIKALNLAHKELPIKRVEIQ